MADEPVISLFSGALGLDLGLEQAGIRTTLAIDVDKHCALTARSNRPHLDYWCADIATLGPQEVLARGSVSRGVFLMAGGPPCQPFSSAGKRAGLTDPRGNLIYVYLKLIEQIRPQYFVLENVANIVTSALRHRPIAARPGKKWNLSSYAGRAKPTDATASPMAADELSGSAITQLVADASAIGYAISVTVVDAADYGAAQRRFRFVMMGARDGAAPLMPPATHGELSPGKRPLRTVRDAIADLSGWPGPHSEYTPGVAKYFRLVPAGGNWRSLPAELQREALGENSFAAGGGKTGFYRRLGWDAPSPTVTGRSNRKGSAMCHPDAVRPLSVRECARLQGFPDDWSFDGAMNQQYLQIGNAVPVVLGRAIGEAILAAHQGVRPPAEPCGVEQSLSAAVRRLRASACNKLSRPKPASRQPTLF